MHTDDPDRASACTYVHLWLVTQKARHLRARQSEDSDFLPVSRERAASAAEAAAGAQTQPGPAAAGAGSRSIPRRPAPPGSRRQPAQGEAFYLTSVSSKVQGLTHTATLGNRRTAVVNAE